MIIANSKKKVKRTFRGRSLYGCKECKARHLKCDEQRPKCGRCVAAGKECHRQSGRWQTGNRALAVSSDRSSSPTTSSESSSPRNPLRSESRVSIKLVQKPAFLTKNLGNPIGDPNGIFSSIKAPHLQNLDSLMHWICVKSPTSPQGWAGNLTQKWCELLPQYSLSDPAFTILTAYFALRVQYGLTGISNTTFTNRAQLITLQEMQKYKTINGPFLMCIAGMAASSAEGGDFEKAQQHLKAIGALWKADNELDVFSWVVIWGGDLRMTTLWGIPPILPHYIPKAYKSPKLLSPEQTIIVYRNAAENALSMVVLLGSDYLTILAILQDLHASHRTEKTQSTPSRLLDLYARSYLLSRRIVNFVHKCDDQALSFDIETASGSDNVCRQLLAITLQSANWQFLNGIISGDAVYEDQGNVHKVHFDRASDILEVFPDTQVLIKKWKTVAGIEGLLWIAAMLVAKSHKWQKVAPSQQPWENFLSEVVQSMNPATTLTPVDILRQWPFDEQEIEVVSRYLRRK